MGDLRAWHVALIVVAVLVLGVSLYYSFGRGKIDMVDKVYMVDVVSGELFVADTSGRRGVVIPAKNPDTGERTVVPAIRVEDGTLLLSDRYRDLALTILEERQTALATAINQATWVIEGDLGNAKAYRSP